jgi:putative PIN family toxin of toxin-antitoxin system
MPRVVFDTNVWVSLLISPGGTCDELFQRLLARGVKMSTSPNLLNELSRVLRQKLGYTTAEAKGILEFVRSVSTVVEPIERVRVVTQKAADNRVLECALAAGAELIISGDTRHLLPLGVFRGILIRSPRAVLDQWR